MFFTTLKPEKPSKKSIFFIFITIFLTSSFNLYGMKPKPTTKSQTKPEKEKPITPTKLSRLPISCVKPIENEKVKKLISEFKKEISPNFDLTIINPCYGSIEILVSGYENDKESDIFLNQLLEKEKGRSTSATKFSEAYIKYFFDKNIVYTGIGSGEARSEFSILFNILLDNKNYNKDIVIQDVHLIDPIYRGEINLVFDQADRKIIKKRLNKIIKQVYLLNKYKYSSPGEKLSEKLKTDTKPIRLFLHENVDSYLKCISRCKLDKTNCLSSFFLVVFKNAEFDLCKFILNGTQDTLFFYRECSFLNPSLQVKILNINEKKQHVNNMFKLMANPKGPFLKYFNEDTLYIPKMLKIMETDTTGLFKHYLKEDVELEKLLTNLLKRPEFTNENLAIDKFDFLYRKLISSDSYTFDAIESLEILKKELISIKPIGELQIKRKRELFSQINAKILKLKKDSEPREKYNENYLKPLPKKPENK